MTHSEYVGQPVLKPTHQLRRAAPVAGVLMALALLTAACSSAGSSGPAVASVSSSASPSSSTGSTRASALAYSRCMRAHGVTDFPDPGADGHITLPGRGAHAQSPKLAAAQQACQSLLPPAEKARNGPDRTQLLKYARCMRAHGVSNFPDPSADGGLTLDPTVVNPNSPQFKAAQQACKSLMPGGGSGGQAGGGS
jgi:hypothetical protein